MAMAIGRLNFRALMFIAIKIGLSYWTSFSRCLLLACADNR
jgi:hypothetical protein